MPRILTIDDSSTIRTIVAKQMAELGFDTEEAEDGVQGLARVAAVSPDLILLDVTMPVMDGPTMLAELRARGHKTAVIMLTSESKRSVVAGAVKLGIDDYILKPFKPAELRAKVLKVLRMETASPDPVASDSAPAPAPASQKPVDVLVIDDMENVHKKLRTLLPAAVAMDGATGARDALRMCQERTYKVVLIDLVIPDVNSVALMKQIHVLQPHAVMVALGLRTTNDLAGETKAQGFAELLFKPFESHALDEFLSNHFDIGDVLAVDGNVLACGAFEGKEERLERYFNRLKSLCMESLQKVASACYDSAILDLSKVALETERVVRMLIDLDKEAQRLGVVLRLVGGADVKKLVGTVADTVAMPFFESCTTAQEAA